MKGIVERNFQTLSGPVRVKKIKNMWSHSVCATGQFLQREDRLSTQRAGIHISCPEMWCCLTFATTENSNILHLRKSFHISSFLKRDQCYHLLTQSVSHNILLWFSIVTPNILEICDHLAITISLVYKLQKNEKHYQFQVNTAFNEN